MMLSSKNFIFNKQGWHHCVYSFDAFIYLWSIDYSVRIGNILHLMLNRCPQISPGTFDKLYYKLFPNSVHEYLHLSPTQEHVPIREAIHQWSSFQLNLYLSL